MTWLDVVLGLVWLGAALSGFWKGAVRLVFSLGGLIAGLWFASVIGADLSGRLEATVGIAAVAVALGYLIPVLLCLLLAFVAGWGLERTCEALRLGWLNRLGGAALAGVAAAVLLGVLVTVAAGVSPEFAAVAQRSTLAGFLLRLVTSLSSAG
jgi:membrane protein required for colicin V production